MAFRQQQCDTYFVESYDLSESEAGENARALEKHLKRQRQKALAQDLSELAYEEYFDDHLRHMQHMEVRLLNMFLVESANVSIDRNLTRCYFNRHSNRDSVVHAPLPA